MTESHKRLIDCRATSCCWVLTRAYPLSRFEGYRRLRIAARHQAEKGRLGVTPRRGALRLGAAIVFKLEQGELAALLRFPHLKLLAAQFDEALPAKSVAIDKYNVGLGHGAITRRPPPWRAFVAGH